MQKLPTTTVLLSAWTKTMTEEERRSAIDDRESCFEEDEKARGDDRTTGSFIHAVINMIGMLIGKFTSPPLN